ANMGNIDGTHKKDTTLKPPQNPEEKIEEENENSWADAEET
ncbi:13238_t:CDS:2, partial [Racocetra persica]